MTANCKVIQIFFFSDSQIVVFLWLERQVSDTVFFQLNWSLEKLEFIQRTLIQVFDFDNNNVSGCGYDRTYDMTFFTFVYFDKKKEMWNKI